MGVIALDLCHILTGKLPRLFNSRNKPAAGEERYCFPAFCATSVREWLYFLKIKTPKKTKQKCQKLCALIDQLQCDTSAPGTVFMFPPTPYIVILSARVICEDGDREKIPTGSACHCEGEGIIVFYQILNSLICWG